MTPSGARHGGDKAAAWAEYALYAVTNDNVDKTGKHYRAFAKEKGEGVMPRIVEIVAADRTAIEGNRAIYFLQLDGKHIVRLVAHPENGDLRVDHLVEVTATYAKGKIPDTAMPLVRAVAAWTSRGGHSRPRNCWSQSNTTRRGCQFRKRGWSGEKGDRPLLALSRATAEPSRGKQAEKPNVSGRETFEGEGLRAEGRLWLNGGGRSGRPERRVEDESETFDGFADVEGDLDVPGRVQLKTGRGVRPHPATNHRLTERVPREVVEELKGMKARENEMNTLE